MKQTSTFAFAHRANAVLACSAAILLAACGGNDTMGTPVQTAALVTSASTSTSGASSTGNTAGNSDAAAASAAAQPLSTESAGIDSYQPDAVTTSVNPDAPADSRTAPASAAYASH